MDETQRHRKLAGSAWLASACRGRLRQGRFVVSFAGSVHMDNSEWPNAERSLDSLLLYSGVLLSSAQLANVKCFHEEIASPRPDGSTANKPLLVAVETTTRCNFRCVHCARAYSREVPSDINLQTFQNVVQLVRTALDVYLFGDGEVLLEIPRHLAMISRIHQEDPACDMGFSTNGRLLTPDVYELYSTAGVRYIQLSVDAATRELYNAMRLGGDFDELVRNLERIKDLRSRTKWRQPQLRLATVISRQNYQQLPLLAEFAERFGFSYWYINVETPYNPGRDLLLLTAEHRAELETFRAAISRNYESSFATFFDPSLQLSPDGDADWLKPWLNTQSPVFCTAPWQRFEVKTNGMIRLCPYHEPVCSIEGRSVDEVWNGEEFCRIRRAFASFTGLPPGCVACRLGIRKQYLPGYPGLDL